MQTCALCTVKNNTTDDLNFSGTLRNRTFDWYFAAGFKATVTHKRRCSPILVQTGTGWRCPKRLNKSPPYFCHSRAAALRRPHLPFRERPSDTTGARVAGRVSRLPFAHSLHVLGTWALFALEGDSLHERPLSEPDNTTTPAARATKCQALFIRWPTLSPLPLSPPERACFAYRHGRVRFADELCRSWKRAHPSCNWVKTMGYV